MNKMFHSHTTVCGRKIMETPSKTTVPADTAAPKKPWVEPECEPVGIALNTLLTPTAGSGDTDYPGS
jgi:hypothetical protein